MASAPSRAVLAALADDTRWQVLSLLGERPASASALAALLPVTRQAIVKHVDVLRSAGLVESEQRGRELVHHAVGSRLTELAHDLDRVGQAWEARLAAVKKTVEGDRS